MREVLRGAELPAQWQKYPLRTQQEMMSGRDALAGSAMERWADEGVEWLNKQFEGKGLEFATSVDIDAREVLLRVFQLEKPLEMPSKGKVPEKYRGRIETEIFRVVEPIESFVSHLTVTKIILIAG